MLNIREIIKLFFYFMFAKNTFDKILCKNNSIFSHIVATFAIVKCNSISYISCSRTYELFSLIFYVPNSDFISIKKISARSLCWYFIVYETLIKLIWQTSVTILLTVSSREESTLTRTSKLRRKFRKIQAALLKGKMMDTHNSRAWSPHKALFFVCKKGM